MADAVMTTDERREAVCLLDQEHRWPVGKIAKGLLMSPDKVRAILHERQEVETVGDQLGALAGPFFPKSGGGR